LVDDEYRGFLPTTTIEKQTYSQRAIAFCCYCFSLILVDEIVSYTWIHKDKKEPSTWKHVEYVIKFRYLTLKQTQKTNPTKQ
jgi:hypothetical protein